MKNVGGELILFLINYLFNVCMYVCMYLYIRNIRLENFKCIINISFLGIKLLLVVIFFFLSYFFF